MSFSQSVTHASQAVTASPPRPTSSPEPAGAVFRHPSSWSKREQRYHAEVSGRAAWETSDTDLAARIDASIEAVREAFPHLDRESILSPPHHWFDAALARQVATTVLFAALNVPKRHIAAVSLMGRDTVWRAINTVEKRRENETFDAAVKRAEKRAVQLFRSR